MSSKIGRPIHDMFLNSELIYFKIVHNENNEKISALKVFYRLDTEVRHAKSFQETETTY